MLVRFTKRISVHHVFANVATKYDMMNDAMSFGIHRLWKDYYVGGLPLASNSKVSLFFPKFNCHYQLIWLLFHFIFGCFLLLVCFSCYICYVFSRIFVEARVLTLHSPLFSHSRLGRFALSHYILPLTNCVCMALEASYSPLNMASIAELRLQ